MATRIISTPSGAQVLDLYDSLLVTASGSILNGTGRGIGTAGTDYNVNIQLFGDVFAGLEAIRLYGTSSGSGDYNGAGYNSIHIGAGVTVASAAPFGDAVVVYGHSNRVTNDGEVSGNGGALLFYGNGNEVVNSGTLTANRFHNALQFVSYAGTTGMTHVFNSGLISGVNGVVSSTGGTLTQVVNSGEIAATGGFAIEHSSTGASHVLELENTGIISAPAAAINADNAADRIQNSGLIIGDVWMKGENDVYLGLGGRVRGIIDGGAGDDEFWIDDPNAQIDGGSGVDLVYLSSDLSGGIELEIIDMRGGGDHSVTDDDTGTRINGNAGSNIIYGMGGDDSLRGGQGDDEIFGGADDDLIVGNAGSDELLGQNGQDTVFGGQQDDLIEGGAGADSLFGGAGDDTILPGTGEDTMAGGGGADVFVFESVVDAGSGSNADRIDNFVRGEDVIDLIALGSTPASFIGTAGFSGGGNMEVRYTVNPFGNALVRIDEDGNGTEDARIVVSQTAILDAGDFLL